MTLTAIAGTQLAAATSTTAGIITAIGVMFVALGGLITTIGVLVPILRSSKLNIIKTEEVHHIVNQQRTDMQRFNVALLSALKHAGVEPPVDQSLPVPGIDLEPSPPGTGPTL